MFEWLKKLFGGGLEKPAAKEAAGAAEIGYVTHYFAKPKVAVIKVKKGKVLPGDILLFKGHTTNFKQKIESLQVDHKPIQEASKGMEVGIQVKAKVRPHDTVFKI